MPTTAARPKPTRHALEAGRARARTGPCRRRRDRRTDRGSAPCDSRPDRERRRQARAGPRPAPARRQQDQHEHDQRRQRRSRPAAHPPHAEPAREAARASAAATTAARSGRAGWRGRVDVGRRAALMAALLPSGELLDRLAGEVGVGVGRIEHLAVEELLDAAAVAGRRRRRRAPWPAARQMSERLTLSTSRILLSRSGGSTPQRTFSVRNHRSCDLHGKDALSRPELHDVRRALDAAAVAVVDRCPVSRGRMSSIGTLMYCRPATIEHMAGRFAILSHHSGLPSPRWCRAWAARDTSPPSRRACRAPSPDGSSRSRTVSAGGVADLLVDQLAVPRLADAEGVLGAGLHVGHHLRRRDRRWSRRRCRG